MEQSGSGYVGLDSNQWSRLVSSSARFETSRYVLHCIVWSGNVSYVFHQVVTRSGWEGVQSPGDWTVQKIAYKCVRLRDVFGSSPTVAHCLSLFSISFFLVIARGNCAAGLSLYGKRTIELSRWCIYSCSALYQLHRRLSWSSYLCWKLHPLRCTGGSKSNVIKNTKSIRIRTYTWWVQKRK